MAPSEPLSDRPLGQLGGAVAAAVVVCYVGYQLVFKPLYNLFFHPLRHFPGPKLWAAFQFPHARSMISGKHHQKLLALHRQYGDVVRISPTQLSYNSPEAWKEIMGHRKKGQSENGKDPIFFKGNEHGILAGDRERHSVNRRVLSHAFSAKSMLEQQPLIQQYIDLFFDRIRQAAAHSSIDIMSWYNYTTFDIIGDLAFGESFGCLETSTLHPWIAIIFESLRQSNLVRALRTSIPYIDALILKLFPSAVEKIKTRKALGEAKVAKRLSLPTQRADFMEAMVNKNKGSLTREEIHENANTLIIAGSETTATVLTFATYALCKHPHVLAKLRAEVDAHFTDESEIDMVRVQGLTYMLAVLDETLRVYPAVPINPWRRTPAEGQDIFGRFVPGDVSTTSFGPWRPLDGKSLLTISRAQTDLPHYLPMGLIPQPGQLHYA